MTNEDDIENYKNSNFAKLNKKQRQKTAPIITRIMRELNNLYLDEVYAILETVEATLIESSQYHSARVPARD